LFRPPPERSALAEFGLRPEDFPPEEIALWPDNVLVKDVFQAMNTQWRAGAAGPSGLDYAVLPIVLRFLGAPRSRHSEVFDGLRVMEMTALASMHRKRPASGGKIS
jgi:hypothetical protein